MKSLQKTGSHYLKYLVTMNMNFEIDYEVITKINVVDSLLNKE